MKSSANPGAGRLKSWSIHGEPECHQCAPHDEPNENKLSGPGRATWRSLLRRPSSHTAPHRRAAWVRWSAWLGKSEDQDIGYNEPSEDQ
jgi:hypothetical protein